MTREDVKYFANCLKSDKRIDYNTMVDFCNEVIESQNKLQKIENMMTREEETKNKDNNNKEYEKDLNKLKERILKDGDTLLTKRDLLERFCEVDKEYNGSPWNLLQILTNINILIGEEHSENAISRKKIEKLKR